MIRVYELPTQVAPVGYLFSGGKPVEFLMVDWFQEPDDVFSAALSRPDLEKFLVTKAYRQAERRYLVVSDTRPDLTFVLEPGALQNTTGGGHG